eukprot:TRINITY_DN8170_c0_g1_i5.p3 TRINITY_DN8170_c0_g1~~TRINITY_DN8170_c0_g1_i5.p3  ORF type:complete len:111 (-),score=26.84 TRINITY_DN8170_c0_g1_i5:38-370(-)
MVAMAKVDMAKAAMAATAKVVMAEDMAKEDMAATAATAKVDMAATAKADMAAMAAMVAREDGEADGDGAPDGAVSEAMVQWEASGDLMEACGLVPWGMVGVEDGGTECND